MVTSFATEGFHEVLRCRTDDPEDFEFVRRRLRTLVLAAATWELADEKEWAINDPILDPRDIDKTVTSSRADVDPRVAAAERRQQEFDLKARRIDRLLARQQEKSTSDHNLRG